MIDLEAIPLGIYEKAIPLSYSWEEKFNVARLANFDYIELSIDGRKPRLDRLDWDEETIAKLNRLTQQYAMPFYTMALSANRFYPLGDPVLFEQGLLIIQKAIVLASKLNIPLIQIAPYDVYQRKSTDETKQRFRDTLEKALLFAEDYPVTLAIEVLEDVPHLSSIAQCVEFTRSIDHPKLKIYADTGNVAYNGINAADDLAYGQELIVACHLKDAVLHNEHNVPYGSGIVDFNACLQQFKRSCFQGTFTAEAWCEESEDFIPQLSVIQTFLSNKIKEENRK